jgi:hypothetical protein
MEIINGALIRLEPMINPAIYYEKESVYVYFNNTWQHAKYNGRDINSSINCKVKIGDKIHIVNLKLIYPMNLTDTNWESRTLYSSER